MSKPLRPSDGELLSARGTRLPDVVARGLDVLLCGINPGLYSAAVGHHFARPGNRFWPTLFKAGLTPSLFSPWQDRELLELKIGLTNVVARATAAADELSNAELVEGAKLLRRKIYRLRPRVLAVVGLGAYRAAFGRPFAQPGLQAERIGPSRVWLLPNPSGLNAHHPPKQLAMMFRALRAFLQRLG